KDDILISLMSQYYPCGKASDYPEINRRLTTFEYRKVLSECEKIGFDGFMQERSSATAELTPDFDFSGL
ncbi:MAG: radical SAM protein, partial [Oscillospiraceae bacterium]|nr:radical SAM protein [Oscillospiraceae bacterium]